MQIFRDGSDITGETITCIAGSTVENLSLVFTDDNGEDVTERAVNLLSGSGGFVVSWAERGTASGRKRGGKKGKKGHAADSKDTNLPSIQVWLLY